MSMLPHCGAVTVGLASVPATLNQFAEIGGKFYLAFVNQYRRAVIYSSVDQPNAPAGLKWDLAYDLGPARGITLRAWCAVVTTNSSTYGLDLHTGNIAFAVGRALGNPVFLPEVRGARFGEYPISWPQQLGFGGVATFIRNTRNGVIQAGMQQPILYVGSLGAGFGGSLRAYMMYTDPFFESNTYPTYATLVDPSNLDDPAYWDVWTDRTKDRFNIYPNALPLRTFISREAQMEGMVNSRGFDGVSVRGTHAAPSQYLSADHWSGRDHDQTPIYIPDLRSNAYQPIASTPSGPVQDDASRRGAVMGFVNGVPRVGMIEPGGGFAHTVLGSSGRHARKFIGNLSDSFAKQRLIMPYNNRIFGMATFGSTPRANGLLEVLWIYDREPEKIFSNATVEDGRYVDSLAQPPRAEVLDGQYTRW